MSRPANKLTSVFALDLRGLAALRVGLGLLILADLVNRARSFGAHYSDSGTLPLADLAKLSHHFQPSIYTLLSSDWAAMALFVVAGVFAVMLMVGCMTRLATVASWFLLISLHTRNPWVLQGGDEIFRALLFWGMFLPLGARFSIDRLRSRPTPASDGGDPPLLVSLATVCLVGQVVMLYAFATISKLSHSVWLHGHGVYYALWVEQFTTHFGLWLRDLWPPLLVGLDYTTLAVQVLAPLALLTPWRRDLLRTVVPLGMCAFHMAFALSMQIGLFSYIVVVMWIPLLPPAAWDWLGERAGRLGERLPRAKTRWTAAGEAIEAHYVRRGTLLSRLRRQGEDADRRPAARLPERVASSVPARVFLGVTFIMVLWWNLWGTDRTIYRVPEIVQDYVHVLRLEQRWKMFSSPPHWSQWFVISGHTAAGDDVDAFPRGGSLGPEKPDLVSATYPSQRWRKYFSNLARKASKPQRALFAAWICRRWNREHHGEQALTGLKLLMYRQPTPHRPGLEPYRPDRVVLGRYKCDE